MLTTEIELKLQELITVDYDHCNWTWLLDPNRTHIPPVLLKALASAKCSSTVVIERPRVPGGVVPVKRKKALAQPSGVSSSQRGTPNRLFPQ